MSDVSTAMEQMRERLGVADLTPGESLAHLQKMVQSTIASNPSEREVIRSEMDRLFAFLAQRLEADPQYTPEQREMIGFQMEMVRAEISSLFGLSMVQ